MKFVDEVRIFVKAGDGGNGAVAFKREKYVERGGPCGGDGGNGGSVVFRADPQLTTLLDFRYLQHHRAKDGEHGLGSDCNGRGSEDMILRVPVGTLIRQYESGTLLCDLGEAGQEYVAAKGGRGGLGNMNFATSTRQTPRFAQDGTAGEEVTLRLELKLLADVGLLGFPNAGKSTLISRVSRARPKVADYPFTTLVPNLGMVRYKDGLSFVVADIPGLIEGASEGAGLGLQFLRHVERCRVLVHLLDMGAEGEGRDPLKDFDILNRELARYSPDLASKPQVVVANKLDLTHAKERLEPLQKALQARGLALLPISCATGEGVQTLLDGVAEVLFTGNTAKLHVEAPASAQKAVKKAARSTGKAPVVATKVFTSRKAVKPVKAKPAVKKIVKGAKAAAAKNLARGAAKVAQVAKKIVKGAKATVKGKATKASAKKLPARVAVKAKAAVKKIVKAVKSPKAKTPTKAKKPAKVTKSSSRSKGARS